MPGPQDHVAEQERSPDQALPRAADGPRETRVRPDDLQGRLERLPTNHPSSPYRDDGSRKPPPPDLSEYELPLPDDPGSPADPDLPADDEPRTNPDGSWDWKGYHLSPEQNRAADQGHARCREAEGRDADGNYSDRGLTPAMRRIEAALDHGHLVPNTETFALKGPDRFKEKLGESIRDEPDKPLKEHVDDVHDGIRYTFLFDEDKYVPALGSLTDILKARGFELGVRRNTWGNEEYKGVNTRWQDHGSGCRFEVQFHTQDSWEAKQATHDSYMLTQDVRTPTAERERLRDYQREISSRLSLPAGWQTITDYRKEGW